LVRGFVSLTRLARASAVETSAGRLDNASAAPFVLPEWRQPRSPKRPSSAKTCPPTSALTALVPMSAGAAAAYPTPSEHAVHALRPSASRSTHRRGMRPRTCPGFNSILWSTSRSGGNPVVVVRALQLLFGAAHAVQQQPAVQRLSRVVPVLQGPFTGFVNVDHTEPTLPNCGVPNHMYSVRE